jgi:hypothetical protein
MPDRQEVTDLRRSKVGEWRKQGGKKRRKEPAGEP